MNFCKTSVPLLTASECSLRTHSLYGELTVGRVPHCWPVSAERLSDSLLEDDVERDWTRLLEQAVFVARTPDNVDGFIHIGRHATNKWQEHEYGVIRFLAYRRGERG